MEHRKTGQQHEKTGDNPFRMGRDENIKFPVMINDLAHFNFPWGRAFTPAFAA